MSQELVAIGVVSAQHEEEGDQDWQPCAARRLLHCSQARDDLYGHLRILARVQNSAAQTVLWTG